MTRVYMRWAAAGMVSVALTLSGCGEDVPEILLDGGPYAPVIDPADFSGGGSNVYYPLEVGTTTVFEGESDGDHEKIQIDVTSDTREILGVSCTVVRDRVWVDGELEEDTYDWFAVDNDGNVWYFGEDSKEIEDGVVVATSGSWEAGVDGALPGIVMEADPRVGDAYRQEHYEGEAEDMAEVVGIGESVTVPYGSYTNVLRTKEWTPLEPDVVEHKFYAQDVGVILETVVKGGEGRIELISLSIPE